MTTLETQMDALDKLWDAREKAAIEQAIGFGFNEELPCWPVMVAAFMRRDVAVKRMAMVEPFGAEWNRLSERVASAEAEIYGRTGRR
jgi:hypothetical protein